MAKDDTAPATKADIKQLLGQLDKRLEKIEERLMHHVDVRYEDIRHGAVGAMNEKLAKQDDRIM